MSVSPLPFRSSASLLAQRLRRAVRAWDSQATLRVEVPVPAVDLLSWIGAQPVGPQVYWKGRGDVEARAAIGIAFGIDASSLNALPSGARQLLAGLPPRARLYGTARFAPDLDVSSEWSDFGRVRFVLPRIELVSDGRVATLAVHLAPGETAGDALAALDLLRPLHASKPYGLASRTERRDAPDFDGWAGAIELALDAFSHGELRKVVLARRTQFLFDGAIQPTALLSRLEAATPRCFHALVRPVPGGPAFVTASPERLFSLQGRALETEAVAGTRPRAIHDSDDDRLLDELLASAKDRREHAFVREAIEDHLQPLAEDIDVDDQTSAMTLARGRHLYTGVRATLRLNATPLDVLAALHPTPAVGGTPRTESLAAIAKLEPFDRGLYAGPIGWIGRDANGAEAAEFAVGIRSGLVDGHMLSLYSGAGIVEGSEAASEWAEIEHKIGDFARVLGLPQPSAA
ncbi:MAG: isochorismate synthase [Rubricoccaceae bacterium]